MWLPLVPVNVMVDEEASRVRPVVVPIFHVVLVGSVYVAVPSLIVLVAEPDALKLPLTSVILLLLMLLSQVPVNAPIVIEMTEIVPPKFSVTVPPPDDPSNVTVSEDPGTD